MFFEEDRVEGKIAIRESENYVYPAHFHLDLELFIVSNGTVDVGLNEREYRLTAGQMIIFDSFDVHEYRWQSEDAKGSLLIIPFGYLKNFQLSKTDFKLTEPLICDKSLCEEVVHIIQRYMKEEARTEVRDAAIGLILSLVCEKLVFSKRKGNDDKMLALKVLTYLQEHFRDEATLTDVSKALGYTQAHVSRAFHRYVRASIPKYVNDLRCHYIENLRKAGDKRKITELIFEAGFKSQQTYYRHKNI